MLYSLPASLPACQPRVRADSITYQPSALSSKRKKINGSKQLIDRFDLKEKEWLADAINLNPDSLQP